MMLVFIPAESFAQGQPAQKDHIEELRIKLNEDGSHYIKATFLNQVWFRFDESNPGSTVMSEPAKQTFDIGLRRTRMQLYGQLTDHVNFYFQFGQNNFNFLSQNAGNRKLQVFFHDALSEYQVKKKSDVLYLGGGLTIANGLSRFSQPSVSTIMSLELPLFAQATIDQTDEYSRKLSVYARGQIGKLDYRLVVSDPFPINTNGTLTNSVTAPVYPASTNAAFAQTGHSKQYQGFFIWNFLESEPHATPYTAGTYLGKKRLLNLETGFITQRDATWTIANINNGAGADNFKYHNMALWSVGIFYDAPVNEDKGTAVNFYGGYFHTDYGPGYLRYSGTMNPASGITSQAAGTSPSGSQGNAFPMYGTGSVFYSQLGYLFERDLLGDENGTLMPYATLQCAEYSRLDKMMTVFDIGLNWLIRSHVSKVTLDYQNRPTYTPVGNDLVRDHRHKSQVTLQYQISF